MRSSECLASRTAENYAPPASIDQSTIGLEIRRRAEMQPDHTAFFSTGFAPFSYSELQRLISEVRAGLRRAGYSRNARVAIAIPNGPNTALAIIAVACSAVSIPLNPMQTIREIEMGFAALRPDAVLLLKGIDSAVRNVADAKGIGIIEVIPSKDGTLGFGIETQIGTAVSADEFSEPDPDAPAFILQTSGTAAEPKLIPFSHRNMLAAAARVQAWFNLSPQDRCLSASPLFYSHGLKVTVFTPLLTGGSIAFPTDSSKFDYAEWFGVLKPTWYSAGPTLHRLIFDQSQHRPNAATGHSLRFVLSGGAPLPQTVLEGLARTLGIPVVEHYGSSEAAQISANLPSPGRSKPGTCGIPSPGTIMIVGDDRRPLPPGEKGDVLVGGPTLISGYLNAPELNRASFVDGWFLSGDVGSLDEDGFLTLYARKAEVINRGGEKISPAEIDEALTSHPAVLEAAAFAVPHARLGEDVVAAVVPRPGMTVTSIELRKHLQTRLTAFKVPRRIVFHTQLPKGLTGKVLRRRLAESWDDKGGPTTVDGPRATGVEPAATELIREMTQVWERLLKISPVTPDDDFFEKGGDSLLAMEMLAELEWRTGHFIPGSILFEATTIRQLAQKIAKEQVVAPKSLIEINSNGDRPPFIYFHGNFHGFGHSAVTLTRLLGSEQPVFVIAPHGTGDEPIPGTIEAMAADRLPLILQAQPEGPYRLGGKCLGGIVAFEVARLLINAGQKVEMVVLLDPPTINTHRAVQTLFRVLESARSIAGPVTERALAWTWFRSVQLQRFWNYPWDRRVTALKRRRDTANKKVRNLFHREDTQASAAPAYLDRSGTPILGLSLKDVRTARYAAVMSHYVPRPLAVPLTYVKVDFGIGAWRRITPDIEVVTSPGTHEFPDIASFAEHLKARLKVRN